MDVRLINPVLETMVNVLSTMANVQPGIGEPSLKQHVNAMGEVTGLMSMVSTQVRASIAISFTKPVIIDIVRHMLGEVIKEIDATALDLIGELTNMVVGGAKDLYAAQGYDFDMSLPVILAGKNHTIHHEFVGKTILLPFTTDSGSFYVEICFEDT